jgi:hypothetical protein
MVQKRLVFIDFTRFVARATFLGFTHDLLQDWVQICINNVHAVFTLVFENFEKRPRPTNPNTSSNDVLSLGKGTDEFFRCARTNTISG